jgi:hypothetical protein
VLWQQLSWFPQAWPIAESKATFLYDNLQISCNLSIQYLPTPWLESLPLPPDFNLEDIKHFTHNGYLLPGDLITASKAGDKNLIAIGRGRSMAANSMRKESPGSVACSQWAIEHLKKDGGGQSRPAWDALPVKVRCTHNKFRYMSKPTSAGLHDSPEATIQIEIVEETRLFCEEFPFKVVQQLYNNTQIIALLF